MYNDGVITTEFTGYYDSVAGEYIYPDAKQNFVISFNTGHYLSASDGDFTAAGITISSEAGSSEDITIGNATSSVLTATMLNPRDMMDDLTWRIGWAYIGVVTAETTADGSSYPAYIKYNNKDYYLTDSGTAYADGNTFSISGTPIAVVLQEFGDCFFITSTKFVYYYNGTFTNITTLTPEQAFMADKYRNLDHPVGIYLEVMSYESREDGKFLGVPTIYNDTVANTKTTYTYVPMGHFDFFNVDKHGIAFTAEAYDEMTRYDADGTEWVKSIAFATPQPLSDIISDMIFDTGMSVSFDSDVVNQSLTFTTNPISTYSTTFRQFTKWIAEVMGCNARMDRSGNVLFWTYNTTSPDATITPDTIIANTRTQARYEVPQITKLVCFDTIGNEYDVGVDGSSYYIVANPFLYPDQDMTPLNNIYGLLTAIPKYYPTAITVTCADPRIDIGDLVEIQNIDRVTSHVIPIMKQTLRWNGTCTTTFIATGNQVRTIPSSLEVGDIGSQVSSNPAAVINLLEGEGIGIVDYDTGSVSVASGTAATECTSIDLTPGTWFIACQANFDQNGSGYRRAVLSATQNSMSAPYRTLQTSNAGIANTYAMLHFGSVIQVTTDTTYYLNVNQTSGSTLTCSWGYSAVRLL